MTLTQCDLCKKKIPKKEYNVDIATGNPWSRTELCAKCAKPITDFLEKHGLGPKKD